eukprot:m51a1_g3955 putative ada2p (485) ;mRNA; r:345704-348004
MVRERRDDDPPAPALAPSAPPAAPAVDVAASAEAVAPPGQPKTPQFHCNNCHKNITLDRDRIKCAKCADFDLCHDCWSVGVELFPHKKEHPYILAGELVLMTLFEPGWTALEELTLLEGLELYGLGNWKDISEHTGTKTAEQCKAHYFEYYLNRANPAYPNPDLSRLLTNHAGMSRAPGASAAPAPEAPAEVVEVPKPPVDEFTTYNPRRGEYECEWENEIEQSLRDVVYTYDDPPDIKDAKIKAILGYRAIVDERRRRRDIIVDRDLFHKRGLGNLSKSFPDFAAKCAPSISRMKGFVQVIPWQEATEFAANLAREYQCKVGIGMQKQYRLNGVRTLDEGDVYDEASVQIRQGLFPKAAFAQATADLRSMADARFQGKRRLRTDGTGVGVLRRHKKQRTGLDGRFSCIGLPGYDRLSDAELQLCNFLQLKPETYMTIRDTLVSECSKRGTLAKSEATAIAAPHMDSVRAGKLYDFMLQNSWIG